MAKVILPLFHRQDSQQPFVPWVLDATYCIAMVYMQDETSPMRDKSKIRVSRREK